MVKQSSDARTLSLAALNEKRRAAVQLRLDGLGTGAVAAQTGLSQPTVIGAWKAYLAGGWEAVDARPRGRSAGNGRRLAPAQEAEIFRLVTRHLPDQLGLPHALWQSGAIRKLVVTRTGIALPERTVSLYLQRWGFAAAKPAARIAAGGEILRGWDATTHRAIRARARTEDVAIYWVDEARLVTAETEIKDGRRLSVMRAVTNRGKLLWLAYEGALRAPLLIEFFDRLLQESGRRTFAILDGMHWQRAAEFSHWIAERGERLLTFHLPESGGLPTQQNAPRTRPPRDARPMPAAQPPAPDRTGSLLALQIKHLIAETHSRPPTYAAKNARGDILSMTSMSLTHLQRLEAESIHIMREVVAETENPVMLYSIGKDSAVMLHLAMKAFYPAKPPFPLLHVDTTWKFREMYTFRDQMVAKLGLELLVHINPEGLAKNINPFTHGSAIHTDIMKTEGLKQALDKYGFDAAFGGARRDEEKSRAKERVFSFRSAQHRWDPKNQRPELWHLYNARKHKGESIRVFPLSNWTELDIWQYIYLQNIPIVPLYYAKERPVVERDGTLIMVDDERMPLRPGEVPVMRKVRFRTLGCYPLTGAVESNAETLPAIIQEMLLTTTSERQGRVIDHDSAGSMEKKKQEGYF
jgi:sulfate adenylyltransferase subunit 2